MEPTERAFSLSADTLRAIERQAERDRALFIAESVGAAWVALTSFLRGQSSKEGLSA